jgi:hypothetical protein
MTRLLIIEGHPGLGPPGGVAIVRPSGAGLLTVDLALPGHAGYRCVTALGGGAPDIPILAVVGRDQSTRETALGSRLRAFVRRDRPLRLTPVAGWPSMLGLPPREFDRLMSVVRRCGRFAMQPERQYLLDVRMVGCLSTASSTPRGPAGYADAWHAMQFSIARDARLENRAIA